MEIIFSLFAACGNLLQWRIMGIPLSDGYLKSWECNEEIWRKCSDCVRNGCRKIIRIKIQVKKAERSHNWWTRLMMCSSSTRFRDRKKRTREHIAPRPVVLQAIKGIHHRRTLVTQGIHGVRRHHLLTTMVMDLHLLERGVVLQVPNTLPAARDPEAIDHATVSDRAVRHIHTAKRRPGDKNSVLIPRMMWNCYNIFIYMRHKIIASDAWSSTQPV